MRVRARIGYSPRILQQEVACNGMQVFDSEQQLGGNGDTSHMRLLRSQDSSIPIFLSQQVSLLQRHLFNSTYCGNGQVIYAVILIRFFNFRYDPLLSTGCRIILVHTRIDSKGVCQPAETGSFSTYLELVALAPMTNQVLAKCLHILLF